jgi:hypothetical protein
MGKEWNVLSKTYRAYEQRVMHAAMPMLKTGAYDVCISKRVRTGWDEGDPFMPGKTGEIVSEVVFAEDEDYPPIPEDVWDDMYQRMLEGCSCGRWDCEYA